MTSPPRQQLPGSGPEPLEIAAILGIGFGWIVGFGFVIGWAALLFGRRWTVSQRIVAAFGPVAVCLAPLAISHASPEDSAAGFIAYGLWIAGSLAAAVYLWWTLPGRDGSVS